VKPWVASADLLTGLRVPLAIAFPLVDHAGWRLAIVAAASASDVADGWLARRYGGSRLGEVLDPVVDKLFMLVAFLTVAGHGLLRWWEIAGVLARDIMAAVGAVGVWLLRRPVALPARAGGKAVTICQLLTLTAFIAESVLVRPLAWATAAIAVYAIWDYGRTAARVSQRATAGRPPTEGG
jgi:phosphatidylglycerophosphate synthase